jgi:hypothetical protein
VGVCPVVCIVTLSSRQKVLPPIGRWSIRKWNSCRSKFLTWWFLLNAEPNQDKVLSMSQSHPCMLRNAYRLRAWRSGPVQEEDQWQEEPLRTRSSGGHSSVLNRSFIFSNVTLYSLMEIY